MVAADSPIPYLFVFDPDLVDQKTAVAVYDIAGAVEENPQVAGRGYWRERYILPLDPVALRYFDGAESVDVILHAYLREDAADGGRPVVTDIAVTCSTVGGLPFLVEYRLYCDEHVELSEESKDGSFMASLIVELLADEVYAIESG